MSGHFIRSNGKSFKIAKHDGSQEHDVEVILPEGLAAKFEAARKNIPASIPKSWVGPDGQTHTISWVNNFGLRETGKTGFVHGSVSEHYEIVLDKVANKTLVYFDGSVKPFPAGDTQDRDDLPGKISARLKLGDPPVGWG